MEPLALATGALMQPRVRLAHGAVMPLVGLGTAQESKAETEQAVAAGIAAGYRLIDTAYAYDNEVGVGRGLRHSGAARDDIFVTTKLNGEWHGYHESQKALEASLRRLGLDYVDMYMIHWPLPAQDLYVAAWKGLIALRERGLARAIGTSNFKPAHIKRLIDSTGIAPEVNQIQLNPLVTRACERTFHADHGIITQSWSPLALGAHQILAGRSSFSEPRSVASSTAHRNLLNEPVLEEIANRYGKIPAQVVLRWHLELGLGLVVKSSDPDRMRDNLGALEFTLSPTEVDLISALDRGDVAVADSDITGH